MWVAELALRDVRNIRELRVGFEAGLNVFVGANAQGKTSLLESLGLLARGRSFRTEETRSMIRRGAAGLLARGTAVSEAGRNVLEVELSAAARKLRLDGREVPTREYNGRLEVAVYSTERLRSIRGSQRERRQYLDRGAAALWPSYKRAQRQFERVLLQRNAALGAGSRDLHSWDEAFLVVAAELRVGRCAYARRLQEALERGFRPRGERYEVRTQPESAGTAVLERARLERELAACRRGELQARRSLCGPQRDAVLLSIDGHDVASASAGQARSFLLALTLAALDVYRLERGASAVALLDDLDSELDDARSRELLGEVAARGQAFVTTAHPAWAASLADQARIYEVAAGGVRKA
jgi:DNA replication and repair protein RecF